MKFQVLSKDEYGQTAILTTLPDANAARKFLRAQVSDLNFSNALTTDDKFKTLEAYSVEFLDENGNIDEDVLYSGNTTDGRPRKLVKNADSYKTEVISPDETVRILLGVNESNPIPFYLHNAKNKIVDRLGHEMLEGKTEFFIRVI